MAAREVPKARKPLYGKSGLKVLEAIQRASLSLTAPVKINRLLWKSKNPTGSELDFDLDFGRAKAVRPRGSAHVRVGRDR
jgi:hypothetical protein